MPGMQSIGPSVLLIDDEPAVLLSAKVLLNSFGIPEVATLEDSRKVMDYLGAHPVGVIVLDLIMPYVSGTDLLPEIVQNHPGVPVIVMTASQEIDTAVACMKEGAYDYLVKPVEESRFTSSVKRALEMRSLRQQLGMLKRSLVDDQLQHGDAFASIITASRKMRGLFQYVESVAPSSEPVLITGETGVGKGMLAEVVHRLSGRAGELVAFDIGGADDTLFSDTLFGHRRGAFTGADRPRDGLVAHAARGTLFLDEIGDLAPASQVKLLRLVQEQTYLPLGSDVAKKSNVRVVCATNRNLSEQMARGNFRPDLYFRLSVHQIEVPPLRDRREDIPLLLAHFIEEAAMAMSKPAPTPPEALLTLLATYHFPGNVRELRAMVFDAVARHRSGGVLSMDSFRDAIQRQRMPAMPLDTNREISLAGLVIPGNLPFPTLREAERLLVDEAMRRAGGNQGIAATLLGISRPALNRRISRLKEASTDERPV